MSVTVAFAAAVPAGAAVRPASPPLPAAAALSAPKPERPATQPSKNEPGRAVATGDGEVPSLRTERSRTFSSPLSAKGDGPGYTTRISAMPVNYRDGQGNFQKADTRVRHQPGGGWKPAASAGDVTLPEDLTDPVTVGTAEGLVGLSGQLLHLS